MRVWDKGELGEGLFTQGRTATQREGLWLWLNVRRSGNAPE